MGCAELSPGVWCFGRATRVHRVHSCWRGRIRRVGNRAGTRECPGYVERLADINRILLLDGLVENRVN